MLCGWGVKAGMKRLQVNCVLPYLSALENAIVLKGALQNVQVYFTFTLLQHSTHSTVTVSVESPHDISREA